MALFDVLGTMVDMLDRAGIAHMVSGAIASARHGEARATQDIDLVIDPSPEQLDRLLQLLDSTDWYVGDGRAALAHRSQFNVIDTDSGWKIDLIIRKDRPYSAEEFARRQRVEIGGVTTWMVTAEDSILSKLEWAPQSRSERQVRDVRSIVEQQRWSIDWKYLEHWANVLGVEQLLEEATGKA